MRFLILFVFITTSAVAEVFCIKDIENNTNEPYLSYAVLRTVEKAVLESGGRLSCEGNYKTLVVRIVDFRDTPIAYTPRQRISAYNLNLGLSIQAGEKSFSVSGVVPYSLPSGGYGDIPRRRAIDDLLDKIYWSLLENLRR